MDEKKTSVKKMLFFEVNVKILYVFATENVG